MRYIPYTSPEHRQQIIDSLSPDEVLVGERNINLGPDGKPMTNELIIEDDPDAIAMMQAQSARMIESDGMEV